jgi:IMP dehydrogenase/GMP reductase
MNEVKFDFDDLLITPKSHTDIASRYDEVNPYYGDSKDLWLPLITAPMDTVVTLENLTTFTESNISVALPRTIHYDMLNDMYDEPMVDSGLPFPEHTFISLGLCEMRHIIDNPDDYDYLVGELFLLDVANGHMEQVYDTAEAFKKAFPSTKLMVGNIANPETYEWYARGKFVDYIRVGIGNGNACLTTKQTSIGYPKASLIRECYEIKQTLVEEIDDQWKSYNDPKFRILQLHKPSITSAQLPKIVADGGIKDYADIIKALALGADYVMAGSIFNKALESAAQNYLYGIKINRTLAEKFFDWGFPVKKDFYGMSTKIAQKKMGKKVLKTSEGIVRKQKVEYRLKTWVENFEHYLKTAMSYSDARTLEEFIGKADFNLITENAFNRFNK